MTKVLGIDPGMTTGYAYYDTEADFYTFWQIDSRLHADTWRFLTGTEPDEIVYEDFKHRPGLMKAELFSLEVIGVVKLHSELRGGIIKDKFLPAQAKAFWTDDKIKKLELWRPGQKHAMDALRVLLTYLGIRDVVWYKRVLNQLKPPV